MAAAAVTGTTTFHEEVVGGSAAWEDDALRGRGLLFPTTWEASDPRLSGTQTIRANRDLYERLRMQVLTGTSLLENDDGRWVGTAGHLGGAKLGETSTVVMHGEDAYEGLTAYVVMDLETQPASFSAAIFPGDVPELPAAE